MRPDTDGLHAEVGADGCKLRNTGAKHMPAITLFILTAGCEARTDLASPKRGPGGSDERTAARHNGLSSPRQTPCTLCALCSKGYGKASAMLGRALDCLKNRPGKRARKLDESGALAHCTRVESSKPVYGE